MTDQATGQETSSNATPPPKKPKGNQLEGKRSETHTLRETADIFKGSILGENAKSENLPENKATTDKTTTQPKAKKPQGQSEPDAAKAEAEADSDQTGEPSEEEGTEEASEAEGDVEEGEAAEGDNPEDADTDEELHTVIVDGKETQITYDELVSGYYRQADYTKKTNELAQERAKLQSVQEQIADLPQVKEQYQKETGRFAHHAEAVLLAFEKGFMPQLPPDELRTSNPAEYIAQKEKHQEAQQFVAGLQREMVQIKQREAVEHQRNVEKGRAKLLETQPELQKPEVRGQLQKYVIGLGYTEDQIRSEADPRLFELALKAMKWDDLLARNKNLSPKKNRPKVLAQTGARDDKDTVAQKKNSEAVDRHKRNHSVKSASELMAHRIQSSRKR